MFGQSEQNWQNGLRVSKPKTKLGVTLLTLSKQGLEDGHPLLDADGILKELGRRRYENILME